MKQRKSTGKIVAMLTLCVMMLSNITLAYGATRSIQINLSDLNSQNSNKENVQIGLYKVGYIDGTLGNVVFDAQYGISQYPESGDEISQLIEQLSPKVTGTPTYTGVTDGAGQLTFSDIQEGVYLVRADNSENYGKVLPSLALLPYYNVVNGVTQGPLYNVVLEPKASVETQIPTATPTPSGTSTPTSTPRVTTTPRKPTTSQTITAKPTKTGDNTEVMLYIFLGITAAGVAIVIKESRRRRQKYEEK